MDCVAAGHGTIGPRPNVYLGRAGILILAAMFGFKKLEAVGEIRLAFIVPRLFRLCIPFLFWSGVYFVDHRAWHTWPNLLKIVIRDFSGYGWSGQYFFIILFQVAIVLPLVVRTRPTLRRAFSLFALLTVLTAMLARLTLSPTLHKAFDDRCIVFWIPHLALGVALALRDGRRLPSLWPPGMAAVLLAAGLVAIVLRQFLLNRLNFIVWATYQDPILIAVTPVIFWSLSSLSPYLPFGLGGMAAGVGQYSLGVFCLNPLIISAVTRFHLPESVFGNVAAATLLPFGITGLIVLLCLVLSRLLERLGLRSLVK